MNKALLAHSHAYLLMHVWLFNTMAGFRGCRRDGVTTKLKRLSGPMQRFAGLTWAP